MQTINRYDVMRAMEEVVKKKGRNYVDKHHAMMAPTGGGAPQPACFVGTLMHHMVEPSLRATVRHSFSGGGLSFTTTASSYGIHFTDDREKAVVTRLMLVAQARNDADRTWGTILDEMKRLLDSDETASPPSRQVVESERRRTKAMKVPATAKRVELPNLHFLSLTNKK